MASGRAADAGAPGAGGTMPALADELRQGEVRPVYLLEGPDQFRLEQAVAYIRGLVLEPGTEAFSDHRLDAPAAGWSGILQQARMLSMFGGRQVVWARHVDQLKGREKDPEEAALVQYLKEPVASTVLILTGQHCDARRTWVKTAKQHGYHVAFPAPVGAELLAWIRKACRKEGLELEDAAVRLLADLVGSDLQALQGEIEKLSLLTGPDGTPPAADRLPGLVLDQVEFDSFSLTDAAGPGQAPAMLKNWRNQMNQGKSTEELMPLLLTHLRRAALVAACLEEGIAEREIAAESGLNAWMVRNKLLPLARRLGPGAMRRLLNACLDCDQALKGRPLPAIVAGEQLLAAIGGLSVRSRRP